MDEPIRIMPCMDIKDGRVVKGVHFVDLRDAGDPIPCTEAYCQAGADELMLIDTTDTAAGGDSMLDVVRNISPVATVPIAVGGGITDLSEAAAMLEAGADKISTTSTAFRRPEFIAELINEFGREKIIVNFGVASNSAMPSGYEVFIDYGMTATGKDVIEWARQVDDYGVETILPSMKAGDGILTGYDLKILGLLKQEVSAKIIAAGGAGQLEHFYDAIQAGASILLAASVFHFDLISIPELKDYLKSKGVNVC